MNMRLDHQTFRQHSNLCLMRSSDFAKLPAWAMWIAQDANGAWWAFEHEPNEGAASWYENEVGRYQLIGKDVPNTDWRNSLSKVSGMPGVED